MPIKQFASSNPMLTNYAQGLAQDLTSSVAEFISPTCPVMAGTGKYKSFNDKNAFQVLDTSRPIGGPARRIAFDTTDQSYDCQPQALETTIDQAEYDAAGNAGIAAFDIQRAKTRTLVQSAAISHEVKVLTIPLAITAVASVGVWSGGSNDPIAEIDSVIETLATNMGQMPNRILFGIGAWRLFRNHPKVVARVFGTVQGQQTVAANVNQMNAASVFLNPQMELRVGVLAKDTTKEGKTVSKANVVGLNLFVFYASATPDVYDASFMKTFKVNGRNVTDAYTYQDRNCRSDVVACDWSEDIRVTSTASGSRIAVS